MSFVAEWAVAPGQWQRHRGAWYLRPATSLGGGLPMWRIDQRGDHFRLCQRLPLPESPVERLLAQGPTWEAMAAAGRLLSTTAPLLSDEEISEWMSRRPEPRRAWR